MSTLTVDTEDKEERAQKVLETASKYYDILRTKHKGPPEYLLRKAMIMALLDIIE